MLLKDFGLIKLRKCRLIKDFNGTEKRTAILDDKR